MQNDLSWAALWAIIGAAIAGVFSWLVQKNKGQTDQSIAVLAEWSKLNQSLADRLASVEKEFSEYRAHVATEFEDLRRHHFNELEEMRNKHRSEMRSLRDLNEGLQRMIAQNSKSTAHLIGKSPTKDDD